MAVEPTRYAEVTEYRRSLGLPDQGTDEAIEEDLEATSEWLNRRLGRFFGKDDAVSTRVYMTPGARLGDPDSENPWAGSDSSRWLYVDDIADSTGLVIKVDEDRDGSFADETAWAATDYELHPLNADQGPDPKPWTAIYIPSWSTKHAWTPGARAEIQAIHGWPTAPPAPIKAATIQLCSLIRLQGPRARSTIQVGLDQVEQINPEARRIVAQLYELYGKVEL